MKNKGLFSTLFIEENREEVKLDDNGQGRMATLAQKWQTRDDSNSEMLWDSFLKQAISYLQFVSPQKSSAPNVYCLFEDYSFTSPVTVLYFVSPRADIDDVSVGKFWPGKLVAALKKRNLNWGILTNGEKWRLYSLKTAKPYEDFVELDLVSAISGSDNKEYALFERFFHRDSFVKQDEVKDEEENSEDCEAENSSNRENSNTKSNSDSSNLYKCRLDNDAERSEEILEELVKNPLLSQVDEILQYVCNGFIFDTIRKGVEYTEEERSEIFESAVKLLYRALFLFYAEARSLLPSDPDKAEEYRKHSIRHLCEESHKFRWNQRKDTDGYDLWKHLKGLVNAVNDGDPEYGIMGYNGGLFDDQQEKFLGRHKLRNDFLSRALYLLAYVEPWDNDPDNEYAIPYEDLEVRHLGELYENILEFNVTLADTDRIRRRTKKGVEILLASEAKYQPGDTRINKGDVFFGETALERKQTGSYYTPELLVQFLNQKAVINPLRVRFEKEYSKRFDEFCREAQCGQDIATRRGATQSAIALVERFIKDVVLKFKICDPGMGSGHFPVNAANQISDLIVEFLSEIPCIEVLTSKTNCTPNYWRRLVTRHCVYGVDLNPLAVHLAKLSLWLNCFAQDHRLTFLDHHLKCGNSLIGIRKLEQLEKLPERAKEKKRKDDQKLPFPTDLKKACQRAVSEIEKIETMDEDSTDKMKQLQDDAHQKNSSLAALADLYTTYLIDHSIEEEDYKGIFTDLVRDQNDKILFSKKMFGSILDLSSRHRFFHWVLQFPEVFHGENPGFDATIGNPPWDVLEPNSQEFYLAYDPDFRKLTKQEAVRHIEKIHAKNPEVAKKWAVFEKTFYEASAYCKEPAAYTALTSGKIDLYKAFLERFQQILKNGGKLGIVCPSGFYTDEGAMPLRALFFRSGRIECLYGFENRWPVVFKAVDNRFKFILMCFEKGASSGKFKCSFMQHDPNRLPIIESYAVLMSVEQILRFSPDSLNLLEISSQRDVDILSKCYNNHAILGGNENIDIYQELNVTSDARLLNTAGTGYPLYEGKNIWHYDSAFADPRFWIENEVAEKFTRKRYVSSSLRGPKDYRLCFRGVAAATNERTLISAIIPPKILCEVKCTCIGIDGYASTQRMLQMLSILNSYLYDFCIRFRVTSNVSVFLVKQLPWPAFLNTIHASLVARVARLICDSARMNLLWAEVFEQVWTNPGTWYPASSSLDYGPKDERALRRRLAEEAPGLTPKWTAKCGVYDRLPDRRDTGDRAQLRAEIDAYVAHLFGLSRDDFAFILGTFTVLRKKELRAFGEFRSKRKCLEEYDRIEKVFRSW